MSACAILKGAKLFSIVEFNEKFGVACDCQVWLKQPLVDLTEITERHDIVEAFAEDPTLRERLRNLHLRGTLLLSLRSSSYQGHSAFIS